MKNEIKSILNKIEKNEITDAEGMKQLEALRQRYEMVTGNKRNNEKTINKDGHKNADLEFRFDYNENLLKHHLIFGEHVLMGMAHLSMVVAYIKKNYPCKICLIKNALFSSALMLDENEIGAVKIEEADRTEEKIDLVSLSKKNQRSGYQKNASFQLFLNENDTAFNQLDILSLKNNSLKIVNPKTFYTHPEQACYGASLFSVKKVYEIDSGKVLGIIGLTPEMQKEHKQYYLHPALLDACHVTSTLALKGNPVKNHWVPLLIKEIYLDLSLESNGFVESACYVQHKNTNSQISAFDMEIADRKGNVFLLMKGFTTKTVPSRAALLGHSEAIKKAPAQKMMPPIELTTAASDDLKSAIQGFIQSIIAPKLNLPREQVPLEKNFMEMGLDSNSMMEAVKNIEDIGIELYATLFFEYQNIYELAQYLEHEHRSKFEEYLGRAIKEDGKTSFKVPVLKEHLPELTGEEIAVSSREKAFHQEERYHQDIAIIGMHGYLPKSKNLDEFWKNIEASVDMVTEVPLSHWDCKPWFDKDQEADNRTYSKWGGFIDDIDKFDPAFFEISPAFAEWMDPQLRLLLQSAYKTFEDAGVIKQIRGSNTSVYIGSCFHEYWDEILRAHIPIVDYQYWSQVMSSLSGTVSYTFDIQGASIPLDNACASSLTALHLGAESILDGQCEMSLVGGLNLLLSPLHYVHFSKLKALSKNGRCYTFDEKADGYVPGEGIVSVLLKRLDKAMNDGDNIHAILKGTAINHNGHSNNPTSPRPELQTKMLTAAWERSRIDPEDISYIDCHGTGTKLGDPIEINALKRAFKKYTKKTKFCTIGSTKAHIGHLEGAAGLASVIKVILMMKNKKFPKMPNYEKLNPMIQLDNSPFDINTELLDWMPKEGKKRLAGISSFGITGNNAHAVIEEYVPENVKGLDERVIVNPTTQIIIPLSAKKQDRLDELAENLLNYIQINMQFRENSGLKRDQTELMDLAYTLQVGREEMDERLAIVTNSIQELELKLKCFIEGNLNMNGLFRGKAKRNDEILSIFMKDEDQQKAIETWILKKKYHKLMNLWVRGLSFDWNKLYGNRKPHRISIPTYPFAKKRYWVENLIKLPEESNKSASMGGTHQLLQENISDLYEQRFKSIFTGDEFFLKDHIINGVKVLPGVAYLEMAYAAINRSKGYYDENPHHNIMLKNIVWAKPIIVDVAQEVNIGLYPSENDRNKEKIIHFVVFTENPDSAVKRVMHCQGTANAVPSGIIQTLDLENLQGKFTKNKIGPGLCYEFFERMGFELGPAHRGLEEVYVRDVGQGVHEVLAKIELPSCVSDTLRQYSLHPSILDSTIQAVVVLDIEIKKNTRPMLPFSLESIEVVNKCGRSMWAWLRLVPQGGSFKHENGNSGDNFKKFDIDLYNTDGKICLKIRGFSCRRLNKDISAARLSEKDGNHELLILKPVWLENKAADPIADKHDRSLKYKRHYVFFVDVKYDLLILRNIINRQSHADIVFKTIETDKIAIEDRFEDYALAVFEKIQEIFKEKSEGKILIQIVVPEQGLEHVNFALNGLLRTACLEYSKIIGQVIAVDKKDNEEDIIVKLVENSELPDHQMIRYERGRRLNCTFNEIPHIDKKQYLPWKEGGIYLITGGAGGLGLIFAREIAEKVKNAVLILCGRSGLNQQKSSRISELIKSGVKISYKKIDVSDFEAVNDLLKEIRTDYGEINGIIHCAGIIRDNFILKKTKTEFKEVLAPKTKGVMNLDRATKDISDLDFFVVFSSASAVLGNIGQADYSVANAFMDIFARYRNSLLESKKRYGHTLSINWPLWEEGGMKVDKEAEKLLRESKGLIAMETSLGIEAFYHSLVSLETQVMIMTGIKESMMEKLLSTFQKYENTNNVGKKGLQPKGNQIKKDLKKNGNLNESVQKILKKIAAKLLKMRDEDMDIDTEFITYGFDSILLTNFTNVINKKYNLEITPTILFEYPTIAGLAEYFADQHGENFVKQNLVGNQERSNPEKDNDILESKTNRQERYLRSSKKMYTYSYQSEITDKIAVVGMSGRFPMAKDLNEFWDNILNGKDCISEIPIERWDWKELYGDPNKEVNKTNIKWGGFIDGVDEFDPLFFGISPREAESMDPQQRLLMTYAWKAIEDAGYSASSLSGSATGIFIGTTAGGYTEHILNSNKVIEGYTATSGMIPSVGPNRMSYFLNIHGPSEPVETACSSSLVAIHRAISAMKAGECDQAIVGGVNTIISPTLFISLNKAGMLSEDGRCKAFSREANGYVRGEGVGMLFLKKLSAAENDMDHIYGIIRGSAENHGGRASSLTAPNPNAQVQLLEKVYIQAGIDPRSVSYIEAHGTGTKLGDPIEVTALKKAFSNLYERNSDTHIEFSGQAHCGIGSVKTNIGHLEYAAGIAAVIKVLLQMKHKTLVKNLHFKELNPYIKIENSPFYIVQENRKWDSFRNRYGDVIPRRAGVSSFGFGGVNAHLVIEEYVPKSKKALQGEISRNMQFIIVLSAKSREQLKEQVHNLLEFLGNEKSEIIDPGIMLENLAFTLQAGREAFEHRIAIIVNTLEELTEKLSAFLKEDSNISNFHLGHASGDNADLVKLIDDEDFQNTIDSWVRKKRYNKIAELWVKGFGLDWGRFYTKYKPHRISLPTYPFLKTRYWPEKGKEQNFKPVEMTQRDGSFLTQKNTSTFLSGQRYTAILREGAFYLTELCTNGGRYLPRVVYFEMVFEAIKDAMSDIYKNGKTIVLKEIAWLKPNVVKNAPVSVHIKLFRKENEKIPFEVYTDDSNKFNAHCYGYGELHPVPKSEKLDIDLLRKRCPDSVNASKIADILTEMGVYQGTTLQSIEKVHTGQDQILAELQIPKDISRTINNFTLHPSMMHSALQAALLLTGNNGPASNPNRGAALFLPLTLQCLEIFRPCTPMMHVWIRPSDGGCSKTLIEKLDFDLCNEYGYVCAKIKELSFKRIQNVNMYKDLSSQANVLNTNVYLNDNNGTGEKYGLDYDGNDLRKIVQNRVIKIFSEFLKMEPEELEIERNMSDYGMDSIALMQLTLKLNKELQLNITPKTFIEYPNLESFSCYLAKEHKHIFVGAPY